MGVLAPGEAGKLRCTIHGGEFTVLFAREALQGADAGSEGAGSAGAGTPLPPVTPDHLDGVFCVQHPAVPATRRCQSCGGGMCATCDFTLPGYVHFCPVCATKPQPALGPKRRRAMIWSYVCAGGATLGFVLTMAVARAGGGAETQQIVGVLFLLLAFLPSVVGVGLGVGAIDRRHRNPPVLWAATIWNGVVLGIFLLLCIVGLMK